MHRLKLFGLTLLLVFAGFFSASKNIFAAMTVKDTLSSPQLSYFGRLGVGNSLGDSIIRIAVGSTSNPSNTTSNLFPGDTIGIGRNGGPGLDIFTVRDIGDSATFATATALGPNNLAANLPVIATRSAIHTISFTPESNFTSGSWRFLIKATNQSPELANDGIPDQDGFDLGSDIPAGATTGLGTKLKVADIACPFGSAGVGTTTVINGKNYHVITCNLGAGGTNPIGVGVTITIGRDLSVGSQLINPTANTTHSTSGQSTNADVYNYFLQHLDSNGVVYDNYPGKIAVIESVRVTATIDPSITFSIDNSNVGAGDTACGNLLLPNADDTTNSSINFGSLSISTFNDLAHHLSCVTNAQNGYVVSVYEKTGLKNLNTGATFADTSCDGGPNTCNLTTAKPWVTNIAQSQFGYSIQNINVGTTVFNYDQGSGFTAKPFGVGFQNAQAIMSNVSTPTETEQAYICYRIGLDNHQKAGVYQNAIVYLATATF